MASKPDKPAKSKRGPKPMSLPQFNGTFEQAIDLALSKKRPAKGWPKLAARKAK
jgi:hypothetical protein